MDHFINFTNVTAYRGPKPVFEDFTLSIKTGCNTAVLGPNGSGKTTFMKLISSEIHPAVRSGSSLTLFGRNNWNVWDLRAKLGVVSYDLQHEYSPQTVGQDVVMSGFFAGNGTAPHREFTTHEQSRVKEIMRELDIVYLTQRPYGCMSAGEQRRCLLGRALVHKPEVLLLDEPTSGMDLKASLNYTALVQRLMDGGIGILLITHHIHEIPPGIERVILLKEGKVAADGPKERVLTGAGLSAVFDIPLEVTVAQGHYYVVPKGRTA